MKDVVYDDCTAFIGLEYVIPCSDEVWKALKLAMTTFYAFVIAVVLILFSLILSFLFFLSLF